MRWLGHVMFEIEDFWTLKKDFKFPSKKWNFCENYLKCDKSDGLPPVEYFIKNISRDQKNMKKVGELFELFKINETCHHSRTNPSARN